MPSKLLKKIALILSASMIGVVSILPFISSEVFAVTPTNLIADPLVNTASASNSAIPASWLEGGWGTNTTAYSYLKTGDNDTNSVEVSMTKYTSGDAKWYFTPVDVTAGTNYTYSDYYESNVATDVVVQFEDGSGNYTYEDLGAAAASTTWKEYTGSFTVPTSVVNVTVFHLIESVGTLTTDDFSLTVTPTVTTPPPPTTGNLIPNPMITTADPSNANLPNDWSQDGWGTNTDTATYKTTGGFGGSGMTTIKMTKYTSGDQKFYFNPVDVTQDTQYNFTDYYESSVQTVVDAAFNLSNGTIDYEYIGLPGPATTWTKFSSDFAIPQGTTSMTIYHLIQSVGTLSTSDFSMTPYTPVGFNRALISLTFDDSYQDTYTYGLPLLQADGFDSTQFIITDLVGTANYMTVAEVQALNKDGQEVASHTVTHDDMTQETATQVTTELSQSQSTLEGWIGAPVTDMAYPYGMYNAAVQTATAKYYSGARGVEVGLNSKDSFNAMDIKVENIYDTTTTAQVADWVAQAQATKTWLVFVYHSVDPSSTPFGGEQYNVTPTQLSAQLAAIKSSGITVETMKQALAEVESQL